MGQFTTFHLWGAGWVTARWADPGLPGQGSEEGHGSTTVINKVLPSCPCPPTPPPYCPEKNGQMPPISRVLGQRIQHKMGLQRGLPDLT